MLLASNSAGKGSRFGATGPTVLVALLTIAEAAWASSTVIDFDDISAPKLFAQTTALREQYAPLGVHFQGPDANDGGAVLNLQSQMGAMPLSGNNFLAFNRGVYLSDGGVPTDPQVIVFDQLMANVSIWVNCGWFSSSFALTALNDAGAVVDSDTVVQQNRWEQLSVSWPRGIRKVIVEETATDDTFVFDDLSFEPIPEPATLALLALGGLAMLRRRGR